MVRKSKAVSAKPKPHEGQPKKAARPIDGSMSWNDLIKLYPSLAAGPSPSERQAKLLQESEAHEAHSMTAEELGRHIEEFRELWGGDEEIDAFIAWIHKGRREGRYE